ncbi:hypothetical protein A7Q09_01375 [Methylacidiphilum sp. Yel]|nr:hypothetical protein A7Q09_01375 [Methylacidiphilum sp. Yel]
MPKAALLRSTERLVAYKKKKKNNFLSMPNLSISGQKTLFQAVDGTWELDQGFSFTSSFCAC